MAIARPLSQTLGAPRSVQGISFNAGTDLYFGLDDRLSACVIPDDQTINGVPCARGLVHFHPSGELAQAVIARDLEVRTVRFRKGTQLSWNEDGTVAAHLAEAHTIGSATVPRGASARITESGELESWSRRLLDEETIGGLRCQAGSVVTRYGDGRPERLTVAEDTVIGDLAVLGGSDVEFHRNGQVSRLTIAEPATRADVRFEGGTTLVFRDDGTLSLAHLADELAVGDMTYPAGTYLQFDPSGALASHATITWSVLPGARG